MAKPQLKIGNIYDVKITGKGKRAGQVRMLQIIKGGKNAKALVQGETHPVSLLGEDMLTGDLKFHVKESGAIHFNAIGRLVSYKL